MSQFFRENPKTNHWSKITWITVRQRNRKIPSQSGFIGSFDAPWSWINDPFSDFPKKTHPKKLRRLRQQKLHFEIEILRLVKCSATVPCWSRCVKQANRRIRLLGTNSFHTNDESEIYIAEGSRCRQNLKRAWSSRSYVGKCNGNVTLKQSFALGRGFLRLFSSWSRSTFLSTWQEWFSRLASRNRAVYENFTFIPFGIHMSKTSFTP